MDSGTHLINTTVRYRVDRGRNAIGLLQHHRILRVSNQVLNVRASPAVDSLVIIPRNIDTVSTVTQLTDHRPLQWRKVLSLIDKHDVELRGYSSIQEHLQHIGVVDEQLTFLEEGQPLRKSLKLKPAN